MEREELLQNLYEAQNIIQQAETLTLRYNTAKSQLLNLQSYSKVEDKTVVKVYDTLNKVSGKRTKIVQIIIIAVLALNIIQQIITFFSWLPAIKYEGTSQLKSSVTKFVLYCVLVLAVIIIPKILNKIEFKLRNKMFSKIDDKNKNATDTKNAQIIEHNNLIEKETNAINIAMQEIRQIADERLYWYPRNYCYSEAVNYFIEVIANFRADTLKEAVNLYVEELRHRQILDTQQQLVHQQKISNVLSTANLFVNLSTLNAVNQNTTAINNQTSSLRSAINNQTSSINNQTEKISNAIGNASNRIINKLRK